MTPVFLFFQNEFLDLVRASRAQGISHCPVL